MSFYENTEYDEIIFETRSEIPSMTKWYFSIMPYTLINWVMFICELFKVIMVNRKYSLEVLNNRTKVCGKRPRNYVTNMES